VLAQALPLDLALYTSHRKLPISHCPSSTRSSDHHSVEAAEEFDDRQRLLRTDGVGMADIQLQGSGQGRTPTRERRARGPAQPGYRSASVCEIIHPLGMRQQTIRRLM
jgi:hypothetical protein